MKRNVLLTLVACAVLDIAALSAAPAQNAPAQNAPAQNAPVQNAPVQNAPVQNAPAPGGFGRFGGGFRGFGPPPGPPAPVPPEVTMLRPTADELARINSALQRFVAASPEKALLQKYQSLVTVQAPRDNPCIRPAAGIRFPRHPAFVETASTGDFDMLFLGDSITDWWNLDQDQNGNVGGKAVFAKHFGDQKVANFAVAGDTTQGVLWGLQNGEGQGHKPKAVMMMIGTNNSGGDSAPEIAEGVGADVLEARKDFPDAKILLLAIFPRGAGPADPARLKCEEVNKIIAKLDDQKHVFFLNLNPSFLNPQGQLVGFRPDNLHPVAEGYEAWASAVAPILKGWVR